MKLRALLVDDDCLARKDLSLLLQSFEDVQVVGEAENPSDALELICNLNYSVIFLDIGMSGLNVIDLAHQLRDRSNSSIIIFTTAHKEYVFAFALNALEYLIKPISSKRLEEALIKMRKFKGILTEQKNTPLPEKNTFLASPVKPLTVIPVEQKDKITILHQDEIIFVYTDKDKVFIKTPQNSYLTRFTLRELESRLSPDLFFRSHRCYLVNIQRMREIIPYFNGTFTIVVDDNQRSQIPVSRTKSRILKEMLRL